MELTLPRCTLRPYRRDDEASLVRYANNRNISRNMRDRFPHPYTAADAREWTTRVSAQSPIANFAIVVSGEVIGGIGLEPGTDVFRRSAEIGYWLGEPFWGRGIATAVVGGVCNYAFNELGLKRLDTAVLEWNPASMRVLEKCGFAREGVLRRSVAKEGRLVDRMMFARLAEDNDD